MKRLRNLCYDHLPAYFHEVKYFFFDALVFANTIMMKFIGDKNVHPNVWLLRKMSEIVEQRYKAKVSWGFEELWLSYFSNFYS